MKPHTAEIPCFACCRIHFATGETALSDFRALNQFTSEPCWGCRILQKVRADTESGCWVWVGAVDRDGYAISRTPDRSSARVHRVMWEQLRGPIQSGLHVDHLCRNRRCVNPTHLEPVTCAENIRRGDTGKRKPWHKPKPHRDVCRNGHDRSRAIKIVDVGDSWYWRCRECSVAASRERRRRAASHR